ncbi:MAG: phosphodiesterase [Clostridia bacterium]|nr:phosphodiesterase [Clostridia bacterium]
MKLMIASDIHGSAYYCEKMIALFKKEGADKLLLLGDLLYHGARNALPRDYSTLKTAELLNGIKENILCIKGNCDSEVDTLVLEFPVEADFAYFTVAGHSAIAAHGHKTPAYLKKDDLLFNGHFHVPAYEERENCIYINCGSVSIPKENSPHSCLIVADNELIWKDIETGETFMTKTVQS